MAETEQDLENLDIVLGDLEGSIAATQSATTVFQAELKGTEVALAAAGQLATAFTRSVGGSLRNAFDDLVFDGAKLGDVLRNLSLSMSNSALDSVLNPVASHFGNLLGGGLESLIKGILPFENGAAFSGGRVTAFANGGIVNSATAFPMRGGTGLMGEAGPEAIMPLARGADGKLGVRGGGGQSVTVNMNISTPDAASFQRSRTQVAAGVQRALRRSSRNL